MRRILILLILVSILIPCCEKKIELKKNLVVESPAFKNMGYIPKKYTCDGEDISPPLILKNLSKDAKSIVIIVEDPDAPLGTFTHWIIWNIRPMKNIPENIPKKEVVLDGAYQGLNDFRKIGYNGPCPPKGDKPHRYFFKVYVLNRVLDLKPPVNKEKLLKEVKKYTIQYGELVGIYKR